MKFFEKEAGWLMSQYALYTLLMTSPMLHLKSKQSKKQRKTQTLSINLNDGAELSKRRPTMSSEGDNAPTTSSGAAAAAMLNQPIVMDCGTATIKAGFAGGTKPKVCIYLANTMNF